MLARFERLLEEAVEGGLRRVFPVELQPVQLAKAAARAMEDAQVVGIREVEVPNAYELRIAPADLRRFESYRTTLASQLERYLAEYAAERALAPVSAPRVKIVEDPRVRPGAVRAEAHFLDLEPARQGALEEAVSGTRALRLAAQGQPPAHAWLEDPSGRRYVLDPADGLLRVGRSLENDVVLSDTGVSRYHAQLRWDGSAWAVQDVGSTNGTFVEGRRCGAEPVRLTTGARVRLGEAQLVYHVQA